MRIEGSTALVTGANRGLGRALVEALLERGARRIYATARSAASLEALSARDPARIVALELDVSQWTQAQRAAEQASDVDLVINNAGTLASFGVLAGDGADMRQDLETNFFGLFHVARAFAPVLAKQAGGAALVSVLSVASLANMPALGGYSASKAGAWSLTQALRAELTAKQVDVHAVFPGPIDTDMVRSFELPKTSARVVADAILSGVAGGSLDIFPDPMAHEVGDQFAKDPASVARRFAQT